MEARGETSMRIAPNKSIIEGTVRRIVPAADGWGADVELVVDDCKPAPGATDFIRAKAGTGLTLFAAEPDAFAAGHAFAITATVLGGPGGERLVVQEARPR